jgi:aliphatic nitrilase
MCEWGGDYILQQYSDEGNLFIISSSDYISEEFKDLLGKDGEDARTGGGSSGIYGPRGKILAKASADREEIIYAEVNMEDVVRSKMMRDIVGHYNRFDIFKLYVNEEKQQPLYMKSFDEENVIIPKSKHEKQTKIGEINERKES